MHREIICTLLSFTPSLLHSPGSLSTAYWVLPVVHGYCKQRRFSLFGRVLDLTLIARRSRHYAGTRCSVCVSWFDGWVCVFIFLCGSINTVQHNQLAPNDAIRQQTVYYLHHTISATPRFSDPAATADRQARHRAVEVAALPRFPCIPRFPCHTTPSYHLYCTVAPSTHLASKTQYEPPSTPHPTPHRQVPQERHIRARQGCQ